MNFIIFDLEATCWQGRPTHMVSEIIEIGAYKLTPYGEVLSQFNRFVRPILHPQLSAFCQELTSIDQVQINRSQRFDQVVEDFQDWIGVQEEDYLLCSWGNFDRKMLVQDCELHNLESEWAHQHINLKRQYQEIKRLRKPRGLHSAVEKEGFEFTGIHHRGIDDAHNLAKIFAKYLDEWRF